MRKTTEDNDTAALRAIGYQAHCTVESANLAGGKAAVGRLEDKGLIRRDPEYSGCLALTPAGERELAYLDAG